MKAELEFLLWRSGLRIYLRWCSLLQKCRFKKKSSAILLNREQNSTSTSYQRVVQTGTINRIGKALGTLGESEAERSRLPCGTASWCRAWAVGPPGLNSSPAAQGSVPSASHLWNANRETPKPSARVEGFSGSLGPR